MSADKAEVPIDTTGGPDAQTSVPDLLGEILTARQLDEMLRMRCSTIEDYGRRGVIPSIKVGDTADISGSDVAALIERLR
jgi:hypothetical protein